MKKKIYCTPEVTVDIVEDINMICVSAGFGGEEETTDEMHVKYNGFDLFELEETDDEASTFWE